MTANPLRPSNRWVIIVGMQSDFVESLGHCYIENAEKLIDPITTFVKNLDSAYYAGILFVGAKARAPKRLDLVTGHEAPYVRRDYVLRPDGIRTAHYVEEIGCAFGTPGFRHVIPSAIVPRGIQRYVTYVYDWRLIGLYEPGTIEQLEINGPEIPEQVVDYWTGQYSDDTTSAHWTLKKFTERTLDGAIMEVMGIDAGAGINQKGAIDRVISYFARHKIRTTILADKTVSANSYEGESMQEFWEDEVSNRYNGLVSVV